MGLKGLRGTATKILFSHCFVFALETRGENGVNSFLNCHSVLMTDPLLTWKLIAFHNGRLFCYQFGLTIEWFCLICFSIIYCHFLDFTKAFLLCG